MPGFVIFLIIFVFLVLIANAVVLIIRSRNNSSPYGRRGKSAPVEDITVVIRDRNIKHRLESEQDNIRKYLELRKKTWELYDEVRKRYENEN